MRRTTLWIALLGLASLAGECGGGSGSGGDPALEKARRLDRRCQGTGTSPFPPGFDFVPGRPGRLVAASVEPGEVVPIDGRRGAPIIDLSTPILGIPDDSDGDGVVELVEAPVLDGIFTRDPELAANRLALLTASDYEEVIFFDPELGSLVDGLVEMPATLRAGDFPRLPSPGNAALRTAVSTHACVKPAETIDSFGNDYTVGLPPGVFCDPDVPGSFFANFTSGAAVSGGRLFVSSSNAGARIAQPDTQWLPGTVLVYDFDASAPTPRIAPNALAPFLETTGFNATDVTAIEVGGRELVLVSQTGPIGIPRDDPDTPEVEGGTLVLGDAVIDVIDPQTLTVIASYPLGPGAVGFDGPAIDPSGRVAAIGSEARREVYVVDLAPLAALPGNPATPADLAAFVVFDAGSPLVVPKRKGGAPAVSCPGNTSGVAWNDAGDRLFVTDRCDGTLSQFDFARPAPAQPVQQGSFGFRERKAVVAALRADTLGTVRDLGFLRVRPGRPGVDFDGPDVFFTVNQPLGAVCAIRIESR